MTRLILIILLVYASHFHYANAQTFETHVAANIPFASPPTSSAIANPINVSGISSDLDGISLGVVEVAVNLEINQRNLHLFLVSPSGRMIKLVPGNIETSGGNLNHTITFRMDATVSIRSVLQLDALQPAYLPNGNMNALHNGQDPNGNWRLYGVLNHFFPFSNNRINSWSITFGTATGMSPAIGPNNRCTDAMELVPEEPISGDNWGFGSNLDELNLFNNSCYQRLTPATSAWYTFVATCSTDVLRISNLGATRALLLTGSCGASYTRIKCISLAPDQDTIFVNHPNIGDNLIPGQRYYLLVEGDNGVTAAHTITWEPKKCAVSPVGLSVFSGLIDKEQNLQLLWSTAWESDNKGFNIIYKNLDERNSTYTETGLVPAKGGNTGANYDHLIHVHRSGLYHIKLFQIDLDGTVAEVGELYLPVEIEEKETLALIYDADGIHVKLVLKRPEHLEYALYDLSGKLIKKVDYSGNEGYNKIDLPTSLKPSLYIFHVKNARRSEKLKILIP